jgi:hypothetical protein
MYGGGGLQQLFGTVMPLNFEIHVLMAILMEAFNNKKILKKTVQSKSEGCGSVSN